MLNRNFGSYIVEACNPILGFPHILYNRVLEVASWEQILKRLIFHAEPFYT